MTSTAVTVTQTPDVLQLRAKRAPLQRRLRKAGITHDKIAARAKCVRTLVVHFFAGRRSPVDVEVAARALLSERNGKVAS